MKFKVGDKVKITDKVWENYKSYGPNFGPRVITRILEHEIQLDTRNSHPWNGPTYWNEHNLELYKCELCYR